MQYSLATLAAFVGAAMAQTWGFDTITAPVRDEVLTAGSSYDIKWTPDTTYDGKTVTIQLLAGTSNVTLQIADTAVGTGISSSAGSYTWAIPSTLTQENTYGFKLTLESDTSIFQYSNPFNIEFTGASSSSVAATTSAAATSAVSSTSAVETTSAEATTTAAASTTAAATSSVFYSNGTSTNTDLPEPTTAKTTLTTAKVSSGVASTTGSGVNSTSVQTAGAAGKLAPMALIAGAVALVL